MFKLAVLKVVIHEGKKMFLTSPVIEAIPVGGCVQTEKGILHYQVGVNRFSSFDTLGREVDTPIIVFRKGEIFCRGDLSYLGGQNDGYLAFGGFDNPILHGVKPIEVSNPHLFSACAFEEGDEVVFVCRDR